MVIPANAGIQWRLQTGNGFNQCRESDKIGQGFPEFVFVPLFYAHWIPAYAGITFIALTIRTVEAKGTNVMRWPWPESKGDAIFIDNPYRQLQ